MSERVSGWCKCRSYWLIGWFCLYHGAMAVVVMQLITCGNCFSYCVDFVPISPFSLLTFPNKSTDKVRCFLVRGSDGLVVGVKLNSPFNNSIGGTCDTFSQLSFPNWELYVLPLSAFHTDAIKWSFSIDITHYTFPRWLPIIIKAFGRPLDSP